jgi:hypothetical protein
MGAPNAAAANLVPSPDEAIADQFKLGTLFEIHEAPEFVEV